MKFASNRSETLERQTRRLLSEVSTLSGFGIELDYREIPVDSSVTFVRSTPRMRVKKPACRNSIALIRIRFCRSVRPVSLSHKFHCRGK
jgi:hypothetical protein